MSERITKVFGKDIEYKYSLNKNLKEIDGKYVYTAKPCIEKEEINNWVEVCDFVGEPYLINKNIGWFTKSVIGISEDEEVEIENKKFRADLNEIHLFTNKVVNENHLNKCEVECLLEAELKDFNKQMIESNEKLKNYCGVHKLESSETDCVELFKLVYGHNDYTIVDGVIKERSYYTISANSSYITAAKTDDLVDAIRYTTSISSLNGVK